MSPINLGRSTCNYNLDDTHRDDQPRGAHVRPPPDSSTQKTAPLISRPPTQSTAVSVFNLLARQNRTVTTNFLGLQTAKSYGRSGASVHAPVEATYLDYQALMGVMPSGVEAIKLSGLVPEHVLAIQEVARELDTVIAFRAVNPSSAYWIQHGKAPVKDLTIKQKTEKEGLLGGLLISSDDSSENNITTIDAKLFSGKVAAMLQDGKLEIRPNTAEEEADRSQRRFTIHDLEKNQLYKLVLDGEENKFTVLKQDGAEFKAVAFKGRQGVPITADYDAFDYYPRLKSSNFAGYKDIGTSKKPDNNSGAARFKHAADVIRNNLHPQSKFTGLVRSVMNDVLELPEVRNQKGYLGRLSKIDDFVREAINDKVKETCDYPHDVVMHGKEKRNTQYPELCDRVFFVFPDQREPLLSNSWEKTQSVDYALQQEGFVTTTNRVYGQQAGTKVLFEDQRSLGAKGQQLYRVGSGKTITWNGAEAARELYLSYPELLLEETERRLAAAGTESRHVDAQLGAAGQPRGGSIDSVPDWLADFVQLTLMDQPQMASNTGEG